MVLPHFQATHVASNEQNCVCGQKGETTLGQMAQEKPCPGYMTWRVWLQCLAAINNGGHCVQNLFFARVNEEGN